MKPLQRTYRIHLLFTVLPLVAVAVGGALFHEFVVHAVRTNVALNGLILTTALVGAVLMLTRLTAIKREWRIFELFAADTIDSPEGRKLALRSVAGRLLAHVGRIRQAGRASPTEHSQVQEELEDVHRILESRQEVAQYVVGLMIALGLLGTFIGLLETLVAVGHLIGGFSSSDATQDSDQALTKLIGNLQYPLTAMGTAFSASMFGLLCSLMLGLMMLSVRSFQTEFLQYARTVVDRVTAHGHAGEAPATRDDDAALWPHRTLELQRMQLALHDEVRELAEQARAGEARLQRVGTTVAQMLSVLEQRELRTQDMAQALACLPPLLQLATQARDSVGHWGPQLAEAQRQAELQRQAQTHQLVQQMLDASSQMDRAQAERSAAQHLALSALLEQRLAGMEARHTEAAQLRQSLFERQQAQEQWLNAATGAGTALLAGIQELKAAADVQAQISRELLGATRSAATAAAVARAASTDADAAGRVPDDRLAREVVQAIAQLEREVRIGVAALLDGQRQVARTRADAGGGADAVMTEVG